MAMSMNIAASAIQGSGCGQNQSRGCRNRHVQHPHESSRCPQASGNQVQAPDRNGFVDLLSSPMQALGLKGGNQNDRQYDTYLQANQAGNLLKGF